MIGDMVGRNGRDAVKQFLSSKRKSLNIDLVIANGENSAGGFGITQSITRELQLTGVDVITSGNHIWDQKEILGFIEKEPRLLRPANYPETAPGTGLVEVGDIVIINLIGRLFVGEFDCPFKISEEIISKLSTKKILIDFHAEATSEKAALAHFLDGKVTAVVGTHTHVPTADDCILPKGTAFVSDLGMVGALNSVIGFDPDPAIFKFRNQMPTRMKVKQSSLVQFNSVLIDIDDISGKAISISRIDEVIEL